MAIGPLSQYNYSAVIRIKGTAGLVEPPHLDIRAALMRINYSDNLEYITSKGDNWSNIAWRMLGNGRHYWIIADFSEIVDPFLELKPIIKASYVAQVAVSLTAGLKVEFTATDVRKVKRGMILRLQDLDPSNVVSVDVVVQAVNTTTKVITCSPFTVPTGGIPAALSRVSRVFSEQVKLTVPTVQRALFDSLDFKNPLNTLVL